MVHPGDIVFGDADGVVVIQPEGYEEMLVQAEAAAAREVEMRKKFAEGIPSLKSVDRLLEADVPGFIAKNR